MTKFGGRSAAILEVARTIKSKMACIRMIESCMFNTEARSHRSTEKDGNSRLSWNCCRVVRDIPPRIQIRRIKQLKAAIEAEDDGLGVGNVQLEYFGRRKIERSADNAADRIEMGD